MFSLITSSKLTLKLKNAVFQVLGKLYAKVCEKPQMQVN